MLSEEIPTATFTDLYQLTMLQSYWREEMFGEAVFDLFVRRLKNRDYFIATGIQDALREVEDLSFTDEELEYLRGLDEFSDEFIDEFLADFEFTGDVYSVEEGQIVYPNEPIIQVVGPLPEAQLMETFLLNQIQHQTGVASKTSRIVEAAEDSLVADFGMRRGPGAEAALKGSRAMYVAGVGATSNVSAGMKYGIPVTGTMAHSYIEAHDSEREAFKEFATTYPNTIVLIDTYDTIQGVKKVVELMETTDVEIGGVRLDSGDLAELAKECRSILDENGYDEVKIFASSGLNEDKIEKLKSQNAPIDGLGVGTKMMTVSDQPYLDAVYKLCEYDGEGRMKLSSGKSNIPGKKQIYRSDGSEDPSYPSMGSDLGKNECVDFVATREDGSEKTSEPLGLDDAEPLLIHMIEDGEIIRDEDGNIPFFYDLEELRERVSERPKVPRSVELTGALDFKYRETAKRVSERAENETVEVV